MVTVAHKRLTDSVATGLELAGEAVSGLGGRPPAWGLMMVGGQHDGGNVLAAARERLPRIPIVGGACAGTVSPGSVGYSGFESALLLSEHEPEAIVVTRDLAAGEYAAGRRMGAELEAHLDGGASVLMLYDTPREDASGLIVGSELLDGVYSVLGEREDHIFGAGLIGDPGCASGFIYTGQRCERDAAVAVVLPRGTRSALEVMHGVLPLGAVHRITAAEGTRILKLDDRPATEVLMADLGIGLPELAMNPITFSVLLGRRPELDIPHPLDTEGMLIRLIVGMDLQEGWVQLFESDLGVGDRVEVMLRDPLGIFESVERGAQHLGATTLSDGGFGLYIDCAGRTAPFSGTETDEAMVIARGAPEGLPFLGFYAGREIAPVRGRSRPHDWTGVLVTTEFGERVA